MSWARRWHEAGRHLFYVHTFDVVGRDTAGVLGQDRPQLAWTRVTDTEGVLATAAGERTGRLAHWLQLVKPLAALLSRRRLRRQQARFANGDIAYVATVRGQVAAWAWVSLQSQFRCRWSGLRFHLGPGEAYLYDLWSFPDQRSSGAGTYVMKALMQDLFERGEAQRVYGYIESTNRESQVLHRLVLGFQQVQRVQSVRLLSHWAWQLPAAPGETEGPCYRGVSRTPSLAS